MLKTLFPVLLALIGTGSGIAAGWLLKQETIEAVATQETAAETITSEAEHGDEESAPEGAAETSEFVQLNNQFVIPVVDRDTISALIVLSLSIEVETGASPTVYSREPKLRDSFLMVLFDHANMGGFDGAFTTVSNMDTLRNSLSAVAQKIIGTSSRGVLITNITRQDL